MERAIAVFPSMDTHDTIVVQRVTYVLPADIIYAVKDCADACGLTANAFVETALREYLARKLPSVAKPRRLFGF